MPLPTKVLYTEDGRPFVVLVTEGPNEVPYIELLSYSESSRRDSITATRHCACMWEDRDDFVKDMVGTNLYTPGNVVGGVITNIERHAPAEHPELDFVYCDGCDLEEGQGVPTSARDDLAKALTTFPEYGTLQQTGDSNMVSFNLAFYKVTYSTRDFIIMDDEEVPANGFGELNRNMSIYFKPAAENLPVPGGAFKFVSDGTLINEPPAKPFPTIEVQYVWRDVPNLPIQAWFNTVGFCNLTLFHGYYQPETLICLPPELTPHYTPAREFVYDIGFTFVWKLKTWNALFRRNVPPGGGPDPVGSPGFDRIIGQDGSTPGTAKAEFLNLFIG